MRKSFFYAMAALLMLVLTGCSDDDGLGASELCHAWYWHDEMPKNYYDLVVYKNNGTIESVAIINTDDGPRKKSRPGRKGLWFSLNRKRYDEMKEDGLKQEF